MILEERSYHKTSLFVFKKGVMNYVQNVQMQRGTRTMQIFRNVARSGFLFVIISVSKGSEEDVNQRNVTNLNLERERNETRIHKIKRPNCALLRKWLAVKRYCRENRIIQSSG